MPEPRDPDLVQVISNLQRDGGELQRQVDARWGRIPHLTTDPATPPDGAEWIRSDLNQLRYRSNGVTYSYAGATAPLGWIAQTVVTVDQLAVGVGPSNLASYDLVFTAVAGRRYKFTSILTLFPSAAGSGWFVDLVDEFPPATLTNRGRMAQTEHGNVRTRQSGVMITAAALSAGSHTLHMSMTRYLGAGTCDILNGTVNGFLLVEDFGSF